MSVEVLVKVADPPSTTDKLTAQLDRAFRQLSKDYQRQSQHQGRVLERLVGQQNHLVESMRQIGQSVKAIPPPDVSGFVRMVDRQWEGFVKSLKTLTPRDPTVQLPPAFFQQLHTLEEAIRHFSSPVTMPDMTQKFDEMIEAIRRARPKTYGTMSG